MRPLLSRMRCTEALRRIASCIGGSGRYASEFRHLASMFVDPPGTHQVVATRFDGAPLLVDAGEDIGRLLLYRLSFERFELELFAHVVRPRDVVIDVGANIGLYTRVAGGCGARVHAFEPNPSVRAILARNVAQWPGVDVAIHACALGASEGEVTLLCADDSAYTSVVATRRDPIASEVAVRQTCLDAFVNANGIEHVDVLKIDVEGYEGEVLSGGAALLSRDDAPLVLVEIATANLVPAGKTKDEVFAVLQRHGYAVSCASEGLPRIESMGSNAVAEQDNFVAFKPATAARLAGWRAQESRR